jgi:signal transduction histidine kinase
MPDEPSQAQAPGDDWRVVTEELRRLQIDEPKAVLVLAEASMHDPRWSGDALACSRFLLFRASALRRFGRTDEADAQYARAIALARGLSDPKPLCEALLIHAGLLVEVGRFVAATEVTTEALEMDLVLTDAHVAILVLDCVADLSAALGWYDRAAHFNNVALLAFTCWEVPSMAHIEIQLWQTRCQYTLFELLDQRNAGLSHAGPPDLERFYTEHERAKRRAAPATVDTDAQMLEHLAQLVRWIEAAYESPADLAALADELRAQPLPLHGRYASCRGFAQALALAHLGERDRACERFEWCLAQTPRGIPSLRQALLRALADTHAAAGRWRSAYLSRQSAEGERRERVDERVRQHVGALTDRLQRDRFHAQTLLSDELRSPLAAIAALAADPAHRAPDRARDALAQVHKLAGQALVNTEAYLRHAHLQTLQAAQLELLLVPEVMADAVDELYSTDVGSPLQIDVAVIADDERDEDARSFLVHGHYTSLRRVFMQLLNRAALASPPDRAVEVTVRRNESNVVIMVRNHGDGLTLDALALLATGHHHRSERIPGSAAGLRYVADAVRALGGAVFAANMEEGGAMVTMSFGRA